MDVLDLKTLVITRGINVPEEITAQFGRTHRLAPTSDPFACNCLILPGGIPAHMVHVGPGADFSLAVNPAGSPCLTYRGQPVTQVDFPPATRFYEQQTQRWIPLPDDGRASGIGRCFLSVSVAMPIRDGRTAL